MVRLGVMLLHYRQKTYHQAIYYSDTMLCINGLGLRVTLLGSTKLVYVYLKFTSLAALSHTIKWDYIYVDAEYTLQWVNNLCIIFY